MMRYKSALAIAILDLDHFKQVNDGYGRDMGDEALRVIGKVLKDEVRDTDIVARLEGEEFGFALHDANEAKARVALERIRASIEAALIELGGASVRITASIGFSSIVAGTIDIMLKDADNALYRAKRGGRNRIEGPSA